MSGTSRSLIQSLNAVFDYWEQQLENEIPETQQNNQNNQTQSSLGHNQNLHTSELFKSIRAYNEKHNTLQAIVQSTNIHTELYRFYNNQIFPKSNLPREILFLQILKELLPVLNRDEVELWLKTYLKPAVDSANYDLTFVNACRQFINKVGINYEPSEDQELTARRANISDIVMNYVLDLYLSVDNRALKFIDVTPTEIERDSQEFSERIRFIKRNCLSLLYDYSLSHPKSFAIAINSHFIVANERLAVLTLFSHILNSRSSKLHDIVETDLFLNIFKCLLYDFNERILYSCLAVLVMLVPLVSDVISDYVSDLLVIYTRICLWNTYHFTIPFRIATLKDKIKASKMSWDLALPDDMINQNQSTSNTELPYDTRIELDAGHLVSIIYGFFPYSLTLYSQDPLAYFDKYSPRLLDKQHLTLISSMSDREMSPKEKPIVEVIEDITRAYLKSFILHPNFLHPERLSVDYENKNATKWLTEDRNDDSLGIEEIVIGCLSLNPALGFYVPNNDSESSFSRWKSEASLEDGNYAHEFNIRSYNPSLGSVGKSSNGSSGPVSRASSLGGGSIGFNLATLTGPNAVVNRKHSIAPANVGDSRKTSEISFKEVNFDIPEGSREGDDNTSMKSKPNGNDPLKELFFAHETLYNTRSIADLTLGDNSTLNDVRSDVHSLLGDKVNLLRTQPSIASVDSTKETVFSSGSTVSALHDTRRSTIVDFYQRELLLMKNEIEFGSYMKHLNKFQFVKLKLQLNRLKRDGSLWEESSEFLNSKVKYEKLTQDFSNLNDSFSELQKEFDERISKFKNERDDYANKFLKLQESHKDMNESFELLEAENSQLKSQIDTLNKVVIPDKNHIINDLNLKLNDTLNDFKLVEDELKDLKLTRLHSDVNANAQLNPELNEDERQMFNLKQELAMMMERNQKLEQEISVLRSNLETANTSMETRSSTDRNEILQNLNSITKQSEKKIQELSSTILKYESLLEEKNLRIAQLSSSRPISIPGSASVGSESGRLPSQTQMPPQFNNGYSGGGTTNTSINQGNLPYGPQHQFSSGTYDSPMDMYETNRQNSNSSGESVNGNVQLPFNTPPLHTPPLQTPPSVNMAKPPPVPIIKGRGGYQKRSKKHM